MSDDIRFDGRVAVVTGAGNGMGRDYAIKLARMGASVIVNDLGVGSIGGKPNSARADEVVDLIRSEGGKAVASYDSVATEAGGLAIAQKALDEFGRIDILIHNAALMPTTNFVEMTMAEMEAQMGVHLKGSFYVGQPCFKEMRKNGYGRIVFKCSNGILGQSRISAYSAAKSGMIALTNCLAIEGAPYGINCNFILPGALDSGTVAVWDDSKTKPRLDTPDAILANQEDEQTNKTLDVIRKAQKIEFVSPMTLYLCSETSEVTGMGFSSAAGRYARVFLGIGRGWMASDEGAPPSLNDIHAHIEQIKGIDDFYIPRRVQDEMEAMAAERLAYRG